MKKSLFLMSITTLMAMASVPAQAAGEELIYVAVEPCRLADTRKSSVMFKGVPRNFLVSGANLSAQGGDPTGCLHPKAGTGVEPLAISAYIVAVRTAVSVGGWLTAFPSDQTTPTSSSVATVNYAKGQVIGNTTNATLCQPGPGCTPTDGQLGLVSFSSQQHVVIDVQGYFYPGGGAGSCPADMVANGAGCIDKYEASIWSAATGGSQIPASTCAADGSDCGAGAAVPLPIFAQSVKGVTPANQVSWYQAAQACANVGKRLPTTAEWQMAASGTPAGADDGTNGCNTTSGVVMLTGDSNAICVSATGARDMVGNRWEWTAELTALPDTGGFTFAVTDDASGRILGGSYNSGISNSTQDVATVGGGPILATNGEIGFRCAR